MTHTLLSTAMDFGGLIVFYALLWTIGLKAAIAGTIVFLTIDALRRWRFRLGFPRIYILSGLLAVGFGAVDLASETPFMIKWEGVITALVLAGMFALGARGKSMIEELVEQREGKPLDDPEARRFFQLLTWLWAVYFVIKAAVYAVIGEIMPIERAMAVRPVIGTASMLAMVALMWRGPWLFARYERFVAWRRRERRLS